MRTVFGVCNADGSTAKSVPRERFVCTCMCQHTLQSCLQVALLGVLVYTMWPNKATLHHVLCWGCFCETRLCRVALQVALLGFLVYTM